MLSRFQSQIEKFVQELGFGAGPFSISVLSSDMIIYNQICCMNIIRTQK